MVHQSSYALFKSQFVEKFYHQDYPTIKLKDLLSQQLSSERILHPRDETFVTVALYGNGVRQRRMDVYDPKPFLAYRIKNGQFIYSRIDARNGAFGIVPPSLDGAVVSKDFPVFDINTRAILPSILLYSVLEDNFIQQIKQNSLGTTNRQRIKEEVFLYYSIKLPPIELQKEFESILSQFDKSKFLN